MNASVFVAWSRRSFLITVVVSFTVRAAPHLSPLGEGGGSRGSPPSAQTENLEADLASAQAELREHPHDPARLVWVGRRLGYLWRIEEAIDVFSVGIAAHPNYTPLYRHRGHRYLTLRKFDLAAADLRRAAELIAGTRDEVEVDGAANEKNIPLTTTAFNIWYHLALAKYL